MSLPSPLPPPGAARLSPAWAARRVRALFAAGLAVSALMVARSQVGGDQLNLLARGWALVAEGRFIPYGNPMSTGGKAPGGVTSLLVGLPLYLWRDHRAATLLIFAFHVLAYLLLDRALRPILQPVERVLFAVFYWLNPWQLYFSGFLWNPNYLYLFGALHLTTALGQRERPSFQLSLLHVAGLGVALQIHPSALLLVAASLLLWLRGYFRVSWAGALSGLVLAALPLVPWVLAVLAEPSLITAANKGFPGRGLILVFPLLRGLLYWLLYSSLAVSGTLNQFDFTDAFGAGVDRWLAPLLFGAIQAVGFVSAAVVLVANVWMGKRNRHRLRRIAPDASGRTWLHGYVTWNLLAAVLIFSLAPTTPMLWQGLILVQAAVLPIVLWLGALARSRNPRVARFWAPGVKAYAALSLLFSLAMAFGSPHYRCGGRGSQDIVFPLRYDSPMLYELHIQQACPRPLNDPRGWWPDVLAKPVD